MIDLKYSNQRLKMYNGYKGFYYLPRTMPGMQYSQITHGHLF